MKRFFVVFLMLLATLATAETKLDAAGEQRVKALSHELRCLVCQNQTIADSNADLAIDLRTQIREQILAGKTDSQIKDYMVARYGDFVLYKPPMQSNTLLLWVAPFLLLVGAVAFLFWHLAQRRKATAPKPISTEDLQHADTMLESGSTTESNRNKS